MPAQHLQESLSDVNENVNNKKEKAKWWQTEGGDVCPAPLCQSAWSVIGMKCKDQHKLKAYIWHGC